jgi:hypothetical protein
LPLGAARLPSEEDGGGGGEGGADEGGAAIAWASAAEAISTIG